MRTSLFRSADASSSSSTVQYQYARQNQAFPTAALIDYVTNKGQMRSKTQLSQRVSFLVADNFHPAPGNESTNDYFGAPADDFVDFKAANYILQKRLRFLDDDY